MIRINQKKISSVYLFYGNEDFLIEQKSEAIQRIIERKGGDYETNTFDLTEVPIQDLVLEAKTLSLFSKQKVVIGKNAEFLSTGKMKVNHQVESLVQYLQQPVPSVVIILTLPTEKLDKRKKVVKELTKRAELIKCSTLSGKSLMYWVRDRVNHYQFVMEENDIKRLILWVGNDLRRLDQECKKLATYAAGKGKVTFQDIHQLVPRTLEQDVFKLIHQLCVRNREQAFQIWFDLLDQKEEPIRILALIIRQLRLMLYTKILSSQGKTEKEMAEILEAHPYPVKIALKQGTVFSKEELNQYLAQAILIDQQVKSGKGDKAILIEQFLLQW